MKILLNYLHFRKLCVRKYQFSLEQKTLYKRLLFSMQKLFIFMGTIAFLFEKKSSLQTLCIFIL